jgi:hypothetical protein
MIFVELLMAAYLLSAIITVVMVTSAIENRKARLVFAILGFAMPFIFLYATVSAIFSPRSVVPYDSELAKVEDGIEAERVRLFGGEITCPSLGTRWEQAYKFSLERLVQRAAKTSKHLADLGSHIHVGHAA